MVWTVATFYKFVRLPDFAEMQEGLRSHCSALQIRGTILLAEEGINGTLAGSELAIATFLQTLRADPRLADLEPKISQAEEMPFDRLKVRLKREIVTMGLSEIDPNQQVGTYVAPQDWDRLISDPEVLVIDTRNDYEVDIGTFQRAQNPQTQSFRQFPEYVQRHLDPHQFPKVALFCTGGIRCEKASAYMLAQGFQEVYHLKGGILKYLEEIPAAESLWQGECFVFDQRVALQQDLVEGTYEMCLSCGHPVAATETVCPHCANPLKTQ
ncbi:MAG: rhodanese-related sulfurtransferase [Oculatellaceae cyanobacterium Prado106]|jgi:UPF0176 protein|nr:rhodanese-related sulfurtransferase [Oculatellaceae cyanobacterium Prado106]